MKVRLVSHTVFDADFLREQGMQSGADIQALVAYCARVSNPGNQANTDTADKLLKYLVKNKHWSPLGCGPYNT